jgi:hypothetical protein
VRTPLVRHDQGVIPSPDEIQAARTPAGGWTKAQLAAWGVPWPPPTGWKERLENAWRARPTVPPAIRMTLGGFEDFEAVVGRLRATGARREADRTFVVDRPLNPSQAAALLDFITYGRAEGFLQVEINSEEPAAATYEDLEAWCSGNSS